MLLGKTNTHELGGGVTTINPFFGTTHNPRDHSRIAGGSSGGSAAAVAARLVWPPPAATPAAACAFRPRCAAAWSQAHLRTHRHAGLLGACPTFDHVGICAHSVSPTPRICSRPTRWSATIRRLRAGLRAAASARHHRPARRSAPRLLLRRSTRRRPGGRPRDRLPASRGARVRDVSLAGDATRSTTRCSDRSRCPRSATPTRPTGLRAPRRSRATSPRCSPVPVRPQPRHRALSSPSHAFARSGRRALHQRRHTGDAHRAHGGAAD